MRELRQQLGVSQREFADMCFMDPSNMGSIERGETNPTLGTITRIAAALDISVSELTSVVDTNDLDERDAIFSLRDLRRAHFYMMNMPGDWKKNKRINHGF
ncbi:MAG: helix-turn-helix transcriptional regulator [Microbacteriaceae bacterium]|nr:helix-turn-helix transcriptional regulator [Microbacteriaceae bacterium]